MRYEALIRDAWGLTTRFRRLWVLGLFAGGIGPSFSWSTSRDSARGTPSAEGERVAEEIAQWVTANAGLVAALVGLAVLLGLAALVISFVAQGGLTRAGVDATGGRAPTLGEAWGAGLRLFWRYVGLWLVVVAIAIAVGIVAAIAVAIVAGIGLTGGAPLAILLGLVLAVVGIALAVALATTVTFAQRAIAVEAIGPLVALGAGWRLFRAHLGTSVALWIVNIAVAIVAGIAITIAVAIVLIPVAIVGYAIWSAAGIGAALIGLAIVAGAVLVAVLCVLAAIAGTFFWHYWTLAYLRLTTPDAS